MTSIAEKPKSRNPSPSPASATSSGVGTTTVNNSSSSPNRPSSATSAMASSQRLTHQSSTGSLFGNIRSTRDRDIMNLVPSAAECSYAACFCEENVWKLCDHVRTTAPNELSKAFVVFVSNKKQVSLLFYLPPILTEDGSSNTSIYPEISRKIKSFVGWFLFYFFLYQIFFLSYLMIFFKVLL